MSTPARKRLMRDFKRLQQDPPAGISGAPQDNNIMLWNAVIFGWVWFVLCISIMRWLSLSWYRLLIWVFLLHVWVCSPDDTPWDGGMLNDKVSISSLELNLFMLQNAGYTCFECWSLFYNNAYDFFSSWFSWICVSFWGHMRRWYAVSIKISSSLFKVAHLDFLSDH